MAVATVTGWETRPAFKSVGLVCTCGNAVATFEGYASVCGNCGAIYLVTVTVIEVSKRDRAPHSAAPPAFADGPVADTAEPVTPQAGIVGAEPDRDDGHTMGHG